MVNKFGENSSGKRGPPGPPGSSGRPGKIGRQGERGKTGEQGTPGIQGIPGLQGLRGIQGIPGTKGDPGAKGDPGDRGVAGPSGSKGDAGEVGKKGEKGDRGEKGVDGVAGLNIFLKWFPDSAVRMFRESESVTFYFNDAKDGIVWEDETKKTKPVGLLNRGSGENATLVTPTVFPEIAKLKTGKYMMQLNKTLFEIPNIYTATNDDSIVIFALTFKPLTVSMKDCYLFTNATGSRAVSIQNNILHIRGPGSFTEIIFDPKEWNTLLVQYSFIDGRSECFFMINGRRGTLHHPGTPSKPDDKLYIGGHPTIEGSSIHTAIGSFEVYYMDDPNKNDYILSNDMCSLLVEDIESRVIEEKGIRE